MSSAPETSIQAPTPTLHVSDDAIAIQSKQAAVLLVAPRIEIRSATLVLSDYDDEHDAQVQLQVESKTDAKPTASTVAQKPDFKAKSEILSIHIESPVPDSKPTLSSLSASGPASSTNSPSLEQATFTVTNNDKFALFLIMHLPSCMHSVQPSIAEAKQSTSSQVL